MKRTIDRRAFNISDAPGHRQAARRLRLIAVLSLAGVGIAGCGQPAPPAATPAAETSAASAMPAHPPVNQDCASCHAPQRIPSVDPEVLAQSVHARLSCTNCHSDPQQLQVVNCGVCHPRVVRELRSAAHAPNANAANSGAPACVNCHGAHDVARVDSAAFRNVIARRCAVCHEERYEGYMDRFHGQAAALGMAAAPRCEDCHNAHAPLPASNPQSRVAHANLVTTCGACHENANANFTEFDPHPQPSNKAHSALVYYSNLFMVLLLAGVFGFFGLHTVLWLQRSFVAELRRELPHVHRSGTGPYVQRFSVFDRWMHVTVIVSFMLLAMTGLPLKYASTSWAQLLSRLLGGEPAMRAVHLVSAAVTFGYFFIHVGVVIYRFIKTRDFKLFYGVNSLVPNARDIADIGRNFAWFLYLGPRPKLDRWTYWEKFDYWAVFWGVAMIGASGLMLADPALASRLLPGQLLNVAAVVHGEEALLAVGFIFVFHFFHNHLRPENFPMDVTIFTGRLPLDRFKEERPEQYERLVAEGKMENMIVGPPSRSLVVISTIFGFVVVIIGLVLIANVLVTILRD
jgi:cytochrome b subunit of formate dehydrogenase